ncbi:MAG: ATP synthase F1 subunit gamma [Spirochaetes bacterium]|nr:ATP synthase F1 subunit gamma [Spirochaetota bacterium]
MATIKSLTRKIRALKNTRKITKAMKMIAFTRFRRAHKALGDSRAYGEEMGRLVSRLLPAAETPHPLTLPAPRPSGKILIAAFTSERGLCGALNTNMLLSLVPFLSERLAKGVAVTFLNCGRKGNEFFKRKKIAVQIENEPPLKKITPAGARGLADRLAREYAEGKWDEVWVVWTECHSIVRLTPTLERLLPVSLKAGGEPAAGASMLLEPDADTVLDGAIRDAVRTRVFGCYLGENASEHAARMTAMENATNNATVLIDHTTLVRNRMRQAAITRELIEIISGVESMKD